MSNNIDFLKEMRSHWELSNHDITRYEMLGRMIDDWIEELESGTGGKSAQHVVRERPLLTEILKFVNKQAKDDGLWFHAETASEAYLQQELRKLHAEIESRAEGQPEIDVRVPELYWKHRCEAAEEFIAKSPGDPDEQIKAYAHWKKICDIKPETYAG